MCETQKLWEFRVYGEPMQYRAPGFFRRKDGTVQTHPDTRVDKWKAFVKKSIRDQLTSEFEPILAGGPVWMELRIFLTRPKSNKSMYPIVRPDRTNFLKAGEDGIEKGLRHDVEFDVKGNVIKTIGFDDGQVVSGPVELRWAHMNYPGCGRHRPGLIVKLQRMDTSQEKEMNADYQRYLKEQGMEYVTEYYGRDNKKKRSALKRIGI